MKKKLFGFFSLSVVVATAFVSLSSFKNDSTEGTINSNPVVVKCGCYTFDGTTNDGTCTTVGITVCAEEKKCVKGEVGTRCKVGGSDVG